MVWFFIAQYITFIIIFCLIRWKMIKIEKSIEEIDFELSLTETQREQRSKMRSQESINKNKVGTWKK